MNIDVSDFNALIQKVWNYPQIDKNTDYTQLVIKASETDGSGGKITIKDIDRLADYPDVKSVTILGLSQDTFEYFINTYGQQLKYICFWKNKAVEDWSLLSELPDLEGLSWYHNQRITKLWDMTNNKSLKAVMLEDFTRLHDLSGVEKAPSLEWFGIGNAIWSTSEIDSLKPFINSNVKHIDFHGKKIRDMDISFIPDMHNLEIFDFPSNLFSTEEVAWLVAKCPHLKGCSLGPYFIYRSYDTKTQSYYDSDVVIVGKRKPLLSLAVYDNKTKIKKYVDRFNELVEKYKNE